MYPSVFVFAAVVALANFATATPPACFLAAVMEQPNPADTKAICGALEPQMASNLTSKCSGDAFSAAVSVYTSTCKAAQNIDITISSSTPSATQTGPSPPTATGAATGATTTSSNGAPGGTTTGAASTASTTGKNAASRILNQSTCLWMSTVIGFGFAIQYLL